MSQSLGKKSDEVAEQNKTEGNLKYSQNKLIEALKLYNKVSLAFKRFNLILLKVLTFLKALCFAKSSGKLAVIFGNRSAVYFELKKYKESLENIQWAKQHGFPQSRIQKLNEREEKCNQLLDTRLKEEEKFQKYTKLSHPPNPKIPFMVECLEMRTTKRFGRGIYTTSDLKAGDVILIEEPIFASMSEEALKLCCAHCMKNQMLNFVSCAKSSERKFERFITRSIHSEKYRSFYC